MPTPMRNQHGPIEITNHNDIYSYKDIEHNARKFEKYKTSQNQWHQVIIMHNGKYSQIEILDAIYETIAPSDILPCYYKPDSTHDSFFVRDCYEPIEALYDKKLLLQMSNGPPLEIILKMCAAPVKETHINPTKSIESTVIERFDADSKTLNLEKFTYGESMRDVMCRLSVPRTLIKVLTFASRKYGLLIETLKLGYNDLENAHGTHPIIWMKHLKELDLSNNKIDAIKTLDSLPKTTITSILLQGNPLCRSYVNPAAYVAAVKDAMKNMEKLVS